MCRVSQVLDGYYNGENDLYKDLQRNKYYLLIHKSAHSPVEFNKICNIISEYAYQKNYTDRHAFRGAWQTDSWKRSNSDNRQVIRVLFNEKGDCNDRLLRSKYAFTY